MRYDDRGAGKSKGDITRLTVNDSKEDARKALAYLRSQPLFGVVGIAGHSEGGSIGLMLAAEGLPDFVVSMAGMGVKGDSLLLMQLRSLYKDVGDAKENEVLFGFLKHLYAYMETHAEVPDAAEAVDGLAVSTGIVLSAANRAVALQIVQNSNPYFVSLLSLDMPAYLRRVKCPVFALNGSKDRQVDAVCNLGAMRAFLPANKANKVKEYEGLNHLLQHCTTGSPKEYAEIDETFSPEVMADMAQWIKQISRR